jgi:hypothetical protein
MPVHRLPLTPTLSPHAGRGSAPVPSPSPRDNGEREGPIAQRWEGEGLTPAIL